MDEVEIAVSMDKSLVDDGKAGNEYLYKTMKIQWLKREGPPRVPV